MAARPAPGSASNRPPAAPGDSSAGWCPRSACRRRRSAAADATRRAPEIEGRGQVPADGASPRRDVGLVNAEARLDEADERRMVERLRADPATAAPRRDHDERHAHPEAIGADDSIGAARRPGLAPEQLVVERHGRVSGEVADVGVGRDDVVEEAVVLVERDHQRRLGPHVGVAGQRVEHARRVPGAVAGRPRRMLGVGLRGDDPGHARQPIVLDVGGEDVEEPWREPDWRSQSGLAADGGVGLAPA